MNKSFLAVFFIATAFLSSSYFFIRPVSADDTLVKYDGKVEHLFFHSLIVYPEKANTDTKNSEGYKENMITVDQFKKIIDQLYANNFILINSNSLYSFDANGKIT